jgi:wobble nucleotide-excising tRNase
MALSFCFFLTQFKAEGRDPKNLVVVIDDPVSSLDTGARTLAYSLMSRMTKPCCQTIVLTHNLAFMNLVKKEFNAGENKKVSSLLCLDCKSSSDDPEKRSTQLTEMNPLLKNYDTEYHYLFEIVLTASIHGKSEYQYMLPNVTRKLMEIFLAFAEPKQNNLAGALTDANIELEKNNLHALERLIQIASHGSLEGMEKLPTLSIEEAIRATQAAMELIEKRDKTHFDAMCKKCKTKKGA